MSRWGSSVTRTTSLGLWLLAFLIGLVIARRVSITWGQCVTVLLVCCAPLLFRKRLSLLSILLMGLALGGWRGSVFMHKLLPYRHLAGSQISIIATTSSDSVYADKGQIEFDVTNIQAVQPVEQALVGTIGIKGYGLPMVYRGDRVQVQGKLSSAKGSRQARMSFARIERVARGTSKLDVWRRKFTAGLQSVLPEPLGSLGLGILIGQRTTLPDMLTTDMSVVGLTHIVAVSGYNLTIIVSMVRRLLKRRSKYQTATVTFALVLVFIAITGMSASIVRAGVVSGASLLAWYTGRTFRPMVLLLLVAAATAGWFPPYLWSDIGWYLSFLAFAGVLLVAPLFEKRFLTRKPRVVLSLLIETMSAQILTVPLIMFVFGRLSIISLVANMLVVPFVPLAMLASVCAGLAGMWWASVAGWLAVPAVVIMTYMVDVISLLARAPSASLVLAINAWQLTALYVCIVLMLTVWWQKQQKMVKSNQLQTASMSVKSEPANSKIATGEL